MATESSLKGSKGAASALSSALKANLLGNTFVSIVTFGPIQALLNSIK